MAKDRMRRADEFGVLGEEEWMHGDGSPLLLLPQIAVASILFNSIE